jgi:hypothetical protein
MRSAAARARQAAISHRATLVVRQRVPGRTIALEPVDHFGDPPARCQLIGGVQSAQAAKPTPV